jgi:acetyl-CoA decarbonylase/synthase complex subunit gamma
MATAVGDIPVVATKLTARDRRGGYRVRWCLGRSSYRVKPGLYAVGAPTDKSPVLVSANYKLSFDRLREQLSDLDAWLLVLDTKGVNVWCAAGKGTFGTDEIVRRIQLTRLAEIVSHRRIIVPQLGAPGIMAHVVRAQSRFKVRFGPVRAEDIPAYLTAGMKATDEMRLIRFPLKDRLILIPTELVLGTKYALGAVVALAILSGLDSSGFSLERMLSSGPTVALMVLVGYVLATALPPILLPWLPGRSFSVRGFWAGWIVIGALFAIANTSGGDFVSAWTLTGWVLMTLAVASHVAMKFTGCSTFTSLSGTVKEVKAALPFQIGGAVLGVTAWVTGLFR